MISGDGDVACPLETKIRKPPKQLDVDQSNHLRATTCNPNFHLASGESLFSSDNSNLVRSMHDLVRTRWREPIMPSVGVADFSFFSIASRRSKSLVMPIVRKEMPGISWIFLRLCIFRYSTSSGAAFWLELIDVSFRQDGVQCHAYGSLCRSNATDNAFAEGRPVCFATGSGWKSLEVVLIYYCMLLPLGVAAAFLKQEYFNNYI